MPAIPSPKARPAIERTNEKETGVGKELTSLLSEAEAQPVDSAVLAIERTGCYRVVDEKGTVDGKGRRFDVFYTDLHYATKTPHGLEFVFRNTKGDPMIWAIITLVIEKPHWGYVRLFNSEVLPPRFPIDGSENTEDVVYFFHAQAEPVESLKTQTLLVQFWMPGSRFIHFEGSHQLVWKGKTFAHHLGLLRAPRSEMKRGGITATVVDMPEGGYRTGWVSLQGKSMTVGFGTADETKEWAPMKYPDQLDIRDKFAELSAKGFQAVVTFVKNSVKDSPT